MSVLQMFYRTNRINIYQASETLGTLYLPQSVMPHFLRMLIFTVLQNVVLNSMNTGSQSKCYKFAYMPSTSQQCGKKDVAGTEVLTSSRTTYVCVFVHVTSRAFLQSSFAFLCFPSWLFSWVLLWVLNNTVLHSILDTQPGFFSFFSRDLLLYILNGKYLLPFILVVLSSRQYGIFHFFSFVCVSHGKLFILLCVKRDQK